MKEEHEQCKEAHKKEEKKEIQHRNRVNKSFEKMPRFDGTNPAYCFDWLMQVEALVNDNEPETIERSYFSTVESA